MPPPPVENLPHEKCADDSALYLERFPETDFFCSSIHGQREYEWDLTTRNVCRATAGQANDTDEHRLGMMKCLTSDSLIHTDLIVSQYPFHQFNQWSLHFLFSLFNYRGKSLAARSSI